jgi:tRNA threonylcarbamoyl adenosine modification protein YjeE
MKTKTFTSQSIEDTAVIAQEILRYLVDTPAKNMATVLALSGDLGAGKTAFTKLLAQHLGISETVVSPTFVIAKFYDIAEETFVWKRLVHIDAYRLETWNELQTLKLDEVFGNPENLVAIEWPEQVADHPQDGWKKVTFMLDKELRSITFN